jgi:hypothetical protein
VRALFHDRIGPVTMESFLISFAIIGVHMTESRWRGGSA